jgi:hypothetical protein
LVQALTAVQAVQVHLEQSAQQVVLAAVRRNAGAQLPGSGGAGGSGGGAGGLTGNHINLGLISRRNAGNGGSSGNAGNDLATKPFLTKVQTQEAVVLVAV